MVEFEDRSQKQNQGTKTEREYSPTTERRPSSFQGVALSHSAELGHTFFEKIKKKLGIHSEEDEKLLQELIVKHGAVKTMGKTHLATELEHIIKEFHDVDSPGSVMSKEEVQSFSNKLMTYLSAGDTLLELFIRGGTAGNKEDLATINHLEKELIGKFGKKQFAVITNKTSALIEFNLASEIGYAMGKEGGTVDAYIAKIESPELKRAVALGYAHGVKDSGLESAVVDTRNAHHTSEKVAAITANPILGTASGGRVAQSLLASTVGTLATSDAPAVSGTTVVSVRDFNPTQNQTLSSELSLLHLSTLDTSNIPKVLRLLEALPPSQRAILLKEYEESFDTSYENDFARNLSASFSSTPILTALLHDAVSGKGIDREKYQEGCEKIARDYGQVLGAQTQGGNSGINPQYVVAEFKEYAKILGTTPEKLAVIDAAMIQGANVASGSIVATELLDQYREIETQKAIGNGNNVLEAERRLDARLKELGIDEKELKAQAAHDVSQYSTNASKIVENVIVAAEYTQGRDARWLNVGTNEELLLTSLSQATPAEMKLVNQKLLEHAKTLGMKSVDEYLVSELSGMDLEYARALVTGDKIHAAACGVAWGISEKNFAHTEKIMLGLTEAERKKVTADIEANMLGLTAGSLDNQKHAAMAGGSAPATYKFLKYDSLDQLIKDPGLFSDRKHEDQMYLKALFSGSREDVAAAKVVQVVANDGKTTLESVSTLLSAAGSSRAVVAGKVVALMQSHPDKKTLEKHLSAQGIQWLEAEKKADKEASAYHLLEAAVVKQDKTIVTQMLSIDQGAEIALARGVKGTEVEEYVRKSTEEHTLRIQALKKQALQHGTSLENLTENSGIKDLSKESVNLMIQGKPQDIDTLVQNAVAAKNLNGLQMALQGMNSQQMAEYREHLKKDRNYDLKDEVASAFKSRQELEATLFVQYGDSRLRTADERVDVALQLSDYDTSGVDFVVMGRTKLSAQREELERRRKSGESAEQLLTLVKEMEEQTQTVQFGTVLSDAASMYIVVGAVGAASTAVFVIFPPAGIMGLAATSAIATGVSLGIQAAAGSALHGGNYFTEEDRFGADLKHAPIMLLSNTIGGGVGLAVSKGFGQIASATVVEKIGEQAIKNGVQVTSEAGEVVSSRVIGQALLDSKIIYRVGTGMARGAIEGYTTGAIQGGGITFFETYDLKESLKAAHETGVTFAKAGAVIGGVYSIRQPLSMRNAKILSADEVEKALRSGKFDAASLAGKEVIRQGDLEAARIISNRTAGKVLNEAGVASSATRKTQLAELKATGEPVTYGKVADIAVANNREFIPIKSHYLDVQLPQGVSPGKVVVAAARDGVAKATAGVQKITAAAKEIVTPTSVKSSGGDTASATSSTVVAHEAKVADTSALKPAANATAPQESLDATLRRQGGDGPALSDKVLDTSAAKPAANTSPRNESLDDILARQGRDGPATSGKVEPYIAPREPRNRVSGVEAQPSTASTSEPVVSSRARGTDPETLLGTRNSASGVDESSVLTQGNSRQTGTTSRRGTDPDALFGRNGGSGDLGGGEGGVSLSSKTSPLEPAGGSGSGGSGSGGGGGSGGKASGGGSSPTSTKVDSMGIKETSYSSSCPRASMEEELVLAGGNSDGFHVGDGPQPAPAKKVKLQTGKASSISYEHETLYPGEHGGVELSPTRGGKGGGSGAGNSGSGSGLGESEIKLSPSRRSNGIGSVGDNAAAGTGEVEIKLSPSRNGSATSKPVGDSQSLTKEQLLEELKLSPKVSTSRVGENAGANVDSRTMSREELLEAFKKEAQVAKPKAGKVEINDRGAVVENPHDTAKRGVKPLQSPEVSPHETSAPGTAPQHETATQRMAAQNSRVGTAQEHGNSSLKSPAQDVRGMTHADAKLGKANARANALSSMFPRRRFDRGHSIVPGSKELFNRKSEDFIGSHVPDPRGPESKPEDYEYVGRDMFRVEVKGDFATITVVKDNSKKWIVNHGTDRTSNKFDGV